MNNQHKIINSIFSLSIIIFVFLLVNYNVTIYKSYGINFSLADAFCLTLTPKNYILSIGIIELLYLSWFGPTNCIQKLVRYGSVESLLKFWMKTYFKHIIINTSLVSIMLFCYSDINDFPLINWEKVSSFHYNCTGEVSNISFFLVIIRYLFCQILDSIYVFALFILSKLYFKKKGPVIASAIVLSIEFCGVSLFLKKIFIVCLGANEWFISCSICLLLLIVIGFAVLFRIRTKDWLDD